MSLHNSFLDYVKDKPEYQYIFSTEELANTINLKSNKIYLLLIQGRNTYDFETTRENIECDIYIGLAGNIGSNVDTKFGDNIRRLEFEYQKLKTHFIICQEYRLDAISYELDVNKFSENLDCIKVTATFFSYQHLKP